jgi:hypothetical protein
MENSRVQFARSVRSPQDSRSSAESGLTVRSSRIRAMGSKRIARQSPSAGGEEVAEQRAALGFKNTSADLDAMVEAGIAYDVPE